MMRIVLRTALLLTVLFATSPRLYGQAGAQACTEMKYEHQNQIDNVPFRIAEAKGAASDSEGVVMPKVCVGIFTEAQLKLVASTETDANGFFQLKNVPPGEYRLVAHSSGFCPANIRLRIQPNFRTKKQIILHMRLPAIDRCSYGELSLPKTNRTRSAAGTADARL